MADRINLKDQFDKIGIITTSIKDIYDENCSKCPMYIDIEDHMISFGLNHIYDRYISGRVKNTCERCIPGSFERYKVLCGVLNSVEKKLIRDGSKEARTFMRSLLDVTTLNEEEKQKYFDMFDFDMNFLEEPFYGI